jgi:hypothetical protein
VCTSAVETGRTYSATVLEPYSKTGKYPGSDPVGRGSAASCEALGDISEGAVVAVEMTGHEDDGNCARAVGRITQAPSPVTLQAPTAELGHRSALLSSAAKVVIGGCRGSWYISYFRGPLAQTDDPFAAPTAGEVPPAVMRRQFAPDPDAPAGCVACQDYFVVQLSRSGP